jgi:hypothetical protein
MNTLPRAIVAQVLDDPQTYTSLRQHWRGLMNSDRRHELTAVHHLLYLTLCGKDWRKAFTPVSNQRKLENGAFAGWEMFRALALLHSPHYEPLLLAPFDDVITPDVLNKLRALLPKVSADQFQPADFANGVYPFSAYLLEDSNTVKAREQTHG